MPKRTSKKKHDINEIAALIVDTIVSEGDENNTPQKNQAAVELGKLGGKKGGIARAKKLSAKRRSQIAKKAAKSRWDKQRKKG